MSKKYYEGPKFWTEALLDGDCTPADLSDEALLTCWAIFEDDEVALPPAEAVQAEIFKRDLDKPITLTISLKEAHALAQLLDKTDYDGGLGGYIDTLYGVATTLPYPLYIVTDGWRGRAALTQGAGA